MSDSFPQQFGPYVLIRVLGVGGMGDVYLALSGKPGLEKPCVVKRLAQHSTPEDNERFRREANLARKLSHGAIVHTLAVDEIDGELIIAQEFLHGCSLSGLLATCLRQRDHVPVALSIHIAREVARALSYAHEQGVTHRDIAPDNVMLTFTGEVRLLDFGIARTTSDPRLTRPGWSVGREAYAAPEVAAGAAGDPRSDIYALGLVLWQLLAGRPPPSKESPPAPSHLNAEVDQELDYIVVRAIARDPKDRFQRAPEIVKALGSQLPADFSGDAELSGFLQKHYDVVRERELADQDLARGHAFLKTSRTSAPAQAVAGVVAQQTRPMPLGRLAAGVAAAIALGTVAFVAHRAGTRDSPGTEALSGPAAVRSESASSATEKPSPAPVAVAPAISAALPEPRPSRRRVRRGVVDPREADPGPTTPALVADLLAEGQQRFDTGDVDRALQSARAAIRAGGGAPAHLLAGRALGKMDQLQEAERELGIAIRLDPTNALAAQRLREIRERIRAAMPSPP